MNKNYKPVYVHGTKTGKGVIEALIARGGINNCDYKGNCETNLYYISPDTNFICGINEYAQFTPYIIATAEEIKPLKWRAKEGGVYYTITARLTVAESTDDRTLVDNDLYKSENYFQTEEEAIKVLKHIKPYFNNSI